MEKQSLGSSLRRHNVMWGFQRPPKFPFRGLKCHSLSSVPAVNCIREICFSPPTKFVPRSLYIWLQRPLGATKRLSAARKVSEERSEAISRWRALVAYIHKGINNCFSPQNRPWKMTKEPPRSTSTSGNGCNWEILTLEDYPWDVLIF